MSTWNFEWEGHTIIVEYRIHRDTRGLHTKFIYSLHTDGNCLEKKEKDFYGVFNPDFDLENSGILVLEQDNPSFLNLEGRLIDKNSQPHIIKSKLTHSPCKCHVWIDDELITSEGAMVVKNESVKYTAQTDSEPEQKAQAEKPKLAQKPEKEKQTDIYEILMDAICCVMCADRKVTSRERKAVHKILEKTKSPWAKDDIDKRINSFLEHAKKEGMEKMIQMTCGRIPEFKKSKKQEVLMVCLNFMAKADGIVHEKEIEIINKFKSILGIEPNNLTKEAVGHDSQTTEQSAAKLLDKARSELATILQQDGRVGHPVAQDILHKEFQALEENLAAAIKSLQAKADGEYGGLGAHEVGVGLCRLCDATLNDPKWALQKCVGTDRCRDRVAKVLREVEKVAVQLRNGTHGGNTIATKRGKGDGHNKLSVALEKGNLKAVKKYLDRGGDPNAALDGSSLPLHKAIRYGHPKIAKLLIKYGADVNGRDKWGCPPLHYAVVDQGPSGRCLPDVAELLIQKGADVNARSKDGWNALMAARDNYQQEIASLLLRHGAQ